MKPVYLESRGSVLGLFHEPAAPATGVAVLICPPFGWDEQSSYRPRRHWAEDLAGAGHAALRIDLPGTGDSTGSPRDPDLLGAWTEAALDAIRWLRGPVEARRVAVVGLGLGGLIALNAVAAGAMAEDLVLWGVPARGRTLVREIKAFGRLEASQTGEDPADTSQGGLRAGGHLLSVETLRALHDLDCDALVGRAAPERALVLGRDGVPPDATLCGRLEMAGAAVQTDPGAGWGEMMAGPQFARPPDAVFGRVRAWLAADREDLAFAITSPPVPESAATGIGIDDIGVRERVIELDADGSTLFGILAEPMAGRRAEGTAVLLNAGAVRHIGPNRLWTEAARRWAARGVSTLRMDVEGVGESGGDERAYSDDAGLYVPALTRQVVRTLDALDAEGLPSRYLLAGLCSGGFWAFHAALEDERVCRAVLLNPRLLFWDPDIADERELRRALSVVSPSGFRDLLTADRPLARAARVGRRLLTSPRRSLARRRAHADRGDPLCDALDRLQNRGQRLELAFSEREPLHAELVRDRRIDELERRGFGVHGLPFRSHTLKPPGAQAAAHALLDRIVSETFGAPPDQ